MNPSPLATFLALRTRVSVEPIGDGGPETCAALTTGLDTAIQQLGTGVGDGAAIVALGGYGRREQ